jgi:hypothetical protein
MKKQLAFLCLFLPILAQAQILNMTNVKAPATLSPTLTTSTLTLDLGSNIVGNPGTAYTFTLNGQALTNSLVTLTWTSNVEGSTDNANWGSPKTYVVAGGVITGQPVTVYCRIKGSAPAGTLSGQSVTITCSPAPPVTVALTGIVGATPTLSANPTSISGLNGVLGNPGTPQTVSVSFQNSVITATPPTNTEISQDGGSTWSTVNQIFSTGSPKGVQIRTTAAAPAGAISGNLTLSGTNGVSTINVPISGNVASSLTTPDSVKFQILLTHSNLVPGWTEVQGDPSVAVQSFQIPGTTITFSSVSTSSNNWGQFLGACIGVNGGVTNASIPDASNSGVMREAVNTANTYNTTYPQYVIGGLDPNKKYDVEISGTTQYNVAAVASYNVKGASLQTSQALDGHPYNIGPNLTNVLYWDGSPTNNRTGTGFSPDASGNITIYFGIQPGNQVAMLSYIKIWDHTKH